MGVLQKEFYFPDQDLLPGWLWAPMDTTTELPELPFRPWNTSVPICGQSHPACPDDPLSPLLSNTFSRPFHSEGQHAKPVICLLYVCYMSVICLLYAYYMSLICLLYASHMFCSFCTGISKCKQQKYEVSASRKQSFKRTSWGRIVLGGPPTH